MGIFGHNLPQNWIIEMKRYGANWNIRHSQCSKNHGKNMQFRQKMRIPISLLAHALLAFITQIPNKQTKAHTESIKTNLAIIETLKKPFSSEPIVDPFQKTF